MKNIDDLYLFGKIQLEFFDRSNKLIKTQVERNKIVVEGLEELARILAGQSINPIGYIAFGKGESASSGESNAVTDKDVYVTSLSSVTSDDNRTPTVIPGATVSDTYPWSGNRTTIINDPFYTNSADRVTYNSSRDGEVAALKQVILATFGPDDSATSGINESYEKDRPPILKITAELGYDDLVGATIKELMLVFADKQTMFSRKDLGSGISKTDSFRIVVSWFITFNS